MSRKRYLSTATGTDLDLASVSPTAGMCWLLSIPHGDICGRLPADPSEYAATVAPSRRYTRAKAAAIVEELRRAELYLCFTAKDGSIGLCFKARSWIAIQGGALSADSRPEHPGPAGDQAQVLPDDFPAAIRERKGVNAAYAHYEALWATFPEKPQTSPKNGTSLPPSPPPTPSPPPPPQEGGGEAEASTSPAPARANWPTERSALKAVPGYPFEEGRDRQLLDSLADAYGQLDLAQEIRRMKAWLASKNLLPMQGQSGPRQRLRNWMQKADEINREKGPGDVKRADAGSRNRDWYAH